MLRLEVETTISVKTGLGNRQMLVNQFLYKSKKESITAN